jgi:hypothetical protein
LMEQLCLEEKALDDRLEALRENMDNAAKKFGNIHASGDDILEINAGGKIFVTKRSTLTQLTMGTRFGALFSGRWDMKLQRDSRGRFFLDVNSDCFQAIMTHLNELIISSDDNLPPLPSVNDEHLPILWQQLKLFGLWGEVIKPRATYPNSNIIPNDVVVLSKLYDWLKRGEVFGYFNLLYRGTRDGLTTESFSGKLNTMKMESSFIFIMQLVEESSIHGSTHGSYPYSSMYTCKSVTSIRIGKLSFKERELLKRALRNNNLQSSEISVYEQLGEVELTTTTCAHSRSVSSLTLLEVFEVFGSEPTRTKSHAVRTLETRFQHDINNAINKKQECLPQTELKIRALEANFSDENKFVDTFATGDAKDVITLNVRGTTMTTKRSTLLTFEDSVLAQQFDDSKWTEHGYTKLHVKRWTVDEVCTWADNIEGIQEEVGSILRKNGITGCELLALNLDGLKIMGIKRAGTLCLISKEIEALVKATQDVVTLIDHCPYCFGKILDFLRLKQLHAQGLAKDKPALPDVRKDMEERFEKVVNFYFPGEAAKLILGA